LKPSSAGLEPFSALALPPSAIKLLEQPLGDAPTAQTWPWREIAHLAGSGFAWRHSVETSLNHAMDAAPVPGDCPLCCEPLGDDADFLPCPCGYTVSSGGQGGSNDGTVFLAGRAGVHVLLEPHPRDWQWLLPRLSYQVQRPTTAPGSDAECGQRKGQIDSRITCCGKRSGQDCTHSRWCWYAGYLEVSSRCGFASTHCSPSSHDCRRSQCTIPSHARLPPSSRSAHTRWPTGVA